MEKSKKQKKRIVITGGHLTPAFAVVELLKKNSWGIYWFGEKRAVLGKDVKTLEYKVIPEHGIPFYSITSAKLQRAAKFKSLLFFWKIPLGFLQSLFFLSKIKPDVVLSFGGYLSVPVALASWALRIPVILHEQTASPGLANKIVARFATRIAVSFPGSETAFQRRVVLTGNPLREGVLQVAAGRRNKSLGNPPVLYITGGSRGSQVINQAVLPSLSTLLETFVVYHQTGDLDFEVCLGVQNKLPKGQKTRYIVAPNFSFQELYKIFSCADIAVSRAGANSVLEFAALGIPVILIPLPHAGAGEQVENAKALKSRGLAEILFQDRLSPGALRTMLKDMLTRFSDYTAQRVRARELVKEDAAGKILKLIEEQWRKV